MSFSPPTAVELLRLLPEIILTLAGILIMVLEPLTGRGRKGILAALCALALAGALAASMVVGTYHAGPAFQGMLRVDGFATFFRVLTEIVALLVVLCSVGYLKREGHEGGEYYALLLFSAVGQGLMASANELIMIFIGLEISSIATYILAGYLRDDKRGSEAAVKYFLLGSFATAFLLYGIAWIYGLTGSTNLTVIREALANPAAFPESMTLVATAAGLMFVGFAFKVSVAPFQVWAPDVYQGAPAPVTAFLSAGPKAAAFAIFLRVYTTAFGTIGDLWQPLVWLSALLTMVIGNFAALRQTNVKRVLAYSSIAHAGYVMVAIATRSDIGVQAALFYLAAYAFMNVGAFAVITHFSRAGERYVEVEDLAGLGARQPVTAALLTVFLLSLIGVPFTGGFFGKFYIFRAALDARLYGLAVLGLLNSAVAAYYYLRILVVMYMREPGESTATLAPAHAGLRVALWTSAIATILLGVFPGFVMEYAGRSAGMLR